MTSSAPDPSAMDNHTPPERVVLTREGKRRTMPLKYGVLLVLALAAAFAIWRYPAWQGMAQAGAAYGARVGCSCRYIQGRDLKSCESDFVPGMEMISLSDDPETKRVTASAPLLASRSAHYAGDSGCLMDADPA